MLSGKREEDGHFLLKRVADDWHLSDKDFVLVTEHAAYMVVAAQLQGLVHVRCYANTLNLACQ